MKSLLTLNQLKKLAKEFDLPVKSTFTKADFLQAKERVYPNWDNSRKLAFEKKVCQLIVEDHNI